MAGNRSPIAATKSAAGRFGPLVLRCDGRDGYGAARTIHDFFGFPQPLLDFKYPVAGSPDLAQQIAEIVKPHWVGLDRDQWGIDHGAWSVLAHLYPEATVPTVQLSINALKPIDYHLELATKLAPLRENGVMIVASGNIVHNLQNLQWNQPEAAFDWAERFDQAVAKQLDAAPGDILKLNEHPDYELAVPTPDHCIPLLYIAGLAAKGGESVEAIVKGFAMASLSMTC